MTKFQTLFFVLIAAAAFCIAAGGSEGEKGINIIPVEHASFILKAAGRTIYVDPTGSAKSWNAHPNPDLILYTHDHFDHFNKSLHGAIMSKKSVVAGPASMTSQVSKGVALKNGDKKTLAGVPMEAVAMYNMTADRLKFHPKGKGNGYVLTLAGKRIYIAGDTEDTPEMKALKNIDMAFICMNLPYTMTVEQAASAVLAFKPKTVYPYHFRGPDGMSDLEKFKKLVARKKGIQVKVLKWYP